MNRFAADCRLQYPLQLQQQLIAALGNLTLSDTTDAANLPVLLQANAFISDIMALSFSGNINPSAILDVAAAVAASPISQTGFGLHLVVMPVLEAVQQLSLFSKVSVI